jgi:hypothetical protein
LVCELPLISVGRLVIARDGVIELAVADLPARVEQGPTGLVITTDSPMAPLTVDDVRAAIDRVRRLPVGVGLSGRASCPG